MTIRSILTCLLNEPSAARLSEAGSALAERFDAHLVGQHTMEAVVIYPGIAMHVPGPTFETFNIAQREEGEAIEKVFRSVTERRGVNAEWRFVRADATAASDRMIDSARAMDLVVMGRPDKAYDRADQRYALDRVIRDGGRPVLLIPEEGMGETVGKRIVLGHAGTRESTRATFDMLPLLHKGADIHIVHIGDEVDELRDSAMTDISTTLAHHGHNVTMTHRVPHGKSVAEMLIHEANEVGADMIVAGAYGHSRTYAFFLGATTGGLVEHSKVPVLFSA
ncbi:Universal stress protein family protein [Jannaschia faecimaris]|uniref:Universal stress protein family protein n=1 Tax=Jannaschia faecimaris TaxID=1244108 RepID=A0A1H3SRN8_9RHOB|nr:universal stress protein [Jannaschia faecimaris]SDZ40215.1 Universal stress protein family protein [Jannaschia faecimaris]